MSESGIEHLKRAKDTLGSEAALAEAVGVKQPSVNYMLRKGSRVPAEWCLPIERAIAARIEAVGRGELVTKEQLRPDIYPPQDGNPPEAAEPTPEQGRAA